MSPFPYRITVSWSEPDEAYVALVPAVPGAGGDGPTPEDAIRIARESTLEVLEVMRAHGDQVPPPDHAQPAYSGQLRFRMPKTLHRELAEAAQREGVSLNQLMVMYLTRQVRPPAASSPHVAPAKFYLRYPDVITGKYERVLGPDIVGGGYHVRHSTICNSGEEKFMLESITPSRRVQIEKESLPWLKPN